MKKRIIILVLLSVILIICFIPVTTTVNLKINAPYINVYKQITSPKNWLKWQPELKAYSGNELKIDSSKTGFSISAPSIAFSVQKTGISEFNVTDNKTSNSNYAFIPDDKSNKTTAIITRKTNAFGYIWSILTKNSQEDLPIIDLKKIMDDPLLYYGFDIKKELTQEKLLAVKRGIFLKNELCRQSNLMQAELNDFVMRNNLNVVYPLQLQYISHKGDSLQIIMGLPVNKKITILTNNIEYMNMPRGKILVGYFKGIYKDKEKLYNAMQLYMNDNYIHPMIAPFERFENNKLPVNDSTMVDMQVVIPYMQ